MHALTRCFIGEALVEGDSFELPEFFLIERANAQVADRLTGPSPPFCHVRFFSFRHLVSQSQNPDPCKTLICHANTVLLGYTPVEQSN